MRRILVILLQACWLAAVAAPAPGSPSAERQDVLAALRPPVERLAGQPVKFRVDRLNIDAQWAVLHGELVRPDGGEPDWSLAREDTNCHMDLDKGVFAVAHKVDDRWTSEYIDICESEPAYWDVPHLEQIGFPCDLLRGFDAGAEQTPLEECKALRRARNKR